MNTRGDGVAAAGPAERAPHPVPRTGRTERTAPTVRTTVAAAVGIAAWGVLVLHVAALSSAVDPLQHTISDYVALPGGYLVLGLAAGAMAVAGAVLTVAAHRAGAGRLVVGLLGSWAVAMAVAGIFPTNLPDTPPDVVAAVHRYAGAWVFAVLPVAALLLARGPAVRESARRRVRVLAVLAGVLAAAFLLAHLPIVVLGSPAFPLLGGVERVLYGVVIALLVVTARGMRA
jgi:hypothetical protein